MSPAIETLSRADIVQQKGSVSVCELAGAYLEAIKEKHKGLPVLPKFRVLQKLRLDLDKKEEDRTAWDENNLLRAKVTAKSFWMAENGKDRAKELEFEENDSMFVHGVVAGLDVLIDDCWKKLTGSRDDVE